MSWNRTWRRYKHKRTGWERHHDTYLQQAGVRGMDNDPDNDEPSFFGKLLFGDPHSEENEPSPMYDFEFDAVGWIDDLIDNLVWGGKEDDHEI